MENKEILKDFQRELSYCSASRYSSGKRIINVMPNQKLTDAFILIRVIGNCLSIKNASEEVNVRTNELAEYLFENVAKKDENYRYKYYISEDNLNLSDDDIIALSKYNKFFSKELETERQNEEGLER